MTREEAIDVLKRNYPSRCFEDLCKAVDIAIKAIDDLPNDGCEYWDGESNFCALQRPADPVKRGKWIKNEGRCGWHCSACGEDDLYAFAWNCDKGENEQQDRYCPNCGAQMERSEDATD